MAGYVQLPIPADDRATEFHSHAEFFKSDSSLDRKRI